MLQITSGSIGIYLEYSKDVIYVKGVDSQERRATQATLKHALDFILYSLAPVMPVTIDEAYKTMNEGTIFGNVYPNISEGDNAS